MQVQAIRRLTRPDPELFLREHVLTNVPAVIEGAIDDWSARKLWSESYLRQKLGDVSFLYRVSPSNMHPHDPLRPDLDEVGFGSFAEYLEELGKADGARRYLTGEQTLFFNKGQSNAALAPIANDYRLPPYIDAAALRYVGFWLSAKQTISWLHYDGNGCDNLNAQVLGRKRARLFSPHAGEALKPHSSADLGGYNFSQLDVRTLDGSTALTCFEAELAAGDMLFIPAFWWHSFSHQDALNANVNFWWARRTTAFNATTLQWAYAAALTRALAGSREGLPMAMLKQSLEQLGPSTGALMDRVQTEMMRTLLKDPDL